MVALGWETDVCVSCGRRVCSPVDWRLAPFLSIGAAPTRAASMWSAWERLMDILNVGSGLHAISDFGERSSFRPSAGMHLLRPRSGVSQFARLFVGRVLLDETHDKAPTVTHGN